MEFRYENVARTFDDELEKEMSHHESEKAAKREHSDTVQQGESESGIQRIAKGKTPLDEVRAIIDASKQKSAAEEVAEHRVRQKLAGIRGRDVALIDEFLNNAKG